MSEIKWIKLSTSMFDDEKIRLIEQMPDADRLLVCWFKMYLASSKNRDFTITNFAKSTHTNEELLSILLNEDINFVIKMINVFSELDMLNIENDVIFVKRFWLTNQEIRNTKEYKEWRTAVFERDNYTCQNCFQVGGSLQAHHIKPFAEYESLRFEITNGLTLCVDCHKESHKKERENKRKE